MSNREFFNKRRIQQDAFGMWDDVSKLKAVLGNSAFKDMKGMANTLTEAMSGTPIVSSKPFPKINVSMPRTETHPETFEKETFITVEAGLAGFSTDEISVELADLDPVTNFRVLTISAEKTSNRPTSDFSLRELATSKASRDVHLNANHEVASVSYTDGILTIKILVVEDKPPKKTKFTIV